jgi:DNA polymerase-3 subunit delta'
MSEEATAQLERVTPALPWQSEVWSGLTREAAEDRLPHAILLTGEPGTGRARLATALSRFLLCRQPVQGSNCGECKTCELTRTRGHSDWRWISVPAGKRSIGIDQVRESIHFLSQTASLGRFKVLVMEPAERLTLQAANALLKTVEEPPPDTLLLLIARGPAAIPATLRSRCRQLGLATPPESMALDWLALYSADVEQCRRALSLADGSPLRARDLLDDDSGLQVLQRRRDCLRGFISGEHRDRDAVATVLQGLSAEETVTVLLQVVHAQTVAVAGAGDEQSRGRLRVLLTAEAELRRLQRALDAGATPQRDLLPAALAARLQTLLGLPAGG